MNSELWNVIFLTNIFTCFFMCGLCWFVQIIHYPLFKDIAPGDFPAYERKNLRTAFIAAPVMTIELVTAAYIQYVQPGNHLMWIGSGIIFIIWVSTFSLQGPTHVRLTQGYNEKLVTLLIRSNWIRTIGWTIRSVILTVLLYQSLSIKF